MSTIGKTLVLVGGLLIAAGLLVILLEKTPLRLGRLPGDFAWRGKNSVFYFPLATCILISVVLTIIFSLLRRK